MENDEIEAGELRTSTENNSAEKYADIFLEKLARAHRSENDNDDEHADVSLERQARARLPENDNDDDVFLERQARAQRAKNTRMCPNLIYYGECFRKHCNFAHAYEELNAVKCNKGLNCVGRRCDFLHPDERVEDYCYRTGQSICKKRKRHPSPPRCAREYERHYPSKGRRHEYERHCPSKGHRREYPSRRQCCDSGPGQSQNLHVYNYAVNIYAKREVAVEVFAKALFSGARQINITVD